MKELFPKKIDAQERKLYDLIVRRFFATFGEPAVRETMKLIFDVKDEHFVSKGTRTVKKGWHELYGQYVTLEEAAMSNTVVRIKTKDDKS